MRDFLKSHRVILAPMAGVTDAVFRRLCIEQGAQLGYTEMVSAKGLAYANARTGALLATAENEPQVAVQLFGHEPLTMARQAAHIEEELGERLAFIDVNCGCPARKIVSKGDGSALMKDPELAARIVAEIVRAVQHPVTVKFRRGWSDGCGDAVGCNAAGCEGNGGETAPEFARRMEAAGAAALAVHGRFAMQYYHGASCRETIARTVEAVSIPVIGNGDVGSGDDALGLMRDTGCEAVMIGRAAQGNPWVFAQVRAALEGAPVPHAPALEERIAMAKRHAAAMAEQDGHAIVRMRKHAQWYVSGIPGASIARGKLSTCTTLEDFCTVFDELLAYASGNAE